MDTKYVLPGELGVDFSYTKPPPELLVDKGYKYIVGYLTEPPSDVGKRLLNPLDYVRVGLGVLLVWEQSASEANKGYDEGRRDGADARRDATSLGYPTNLPILAACDTNTTATNVQQQVSYMKGFAETCGPMGIYGDVDILRATAPLWQIGWLPNAWYWSNPIARKPGETDAQYNARGRAGAVENGRAAGVHVYQSTGFYIDGKYPVDPNRADLTFPAWGIPRKEEEPMKPYVFQLAGGGLGLRHEAGSRWLNGGELEGPLKNEIVHPIPAGSNWEAWVLRELGKYERELDAPGPVVANVAFPDYVLTKK